MKAIIYHRKCNDGITAAAVMLKHLVENASVDRQSIKIFDADYGDDFPEQIDNNFTEVFIVDFCYPPDVMQTVCERLSQTQFKVHDHHKTAFEKYNGLDYPVNLTTNFQEGPGISGASIVWNYYFGESPKSPPELVADVADRDTWTFARQHSKVTHLALLELGDLRNPRHVYEYYLSGDDSIRTRDHYKELVQKGTIVKETWDNAIAELSKVGFYRHFDRIGPFENQTILFIDCPYRFVSDMAEYFRNNDERCTKDVIFIGMIVNKRSVRLSLRSTNGGAKPLAEFFGGGGHDNASGAEVPYSTLVDLLTKGRPLSGKEELNVNK